MTIQEGLIWTYYDCSNACYLFGEYELPCMIMSLSNILTGMILLIAIGYLLMKFRTGDKG